MGTKIEGDRCLDAAMPDEPMFVLLARDPNMPALVRLWASIRRVQIAEGARPTTDLTQVEEAERLADRAVRWRADADEAWRKQRAFDFVEGTHAEFHEAVETTEPDDHAALQRQGDEYYCSACGKRWSFDESAPPCS